MDVEYQNDRPNEDDMMDPALYDDQKVSPNEAVFDKVPANNQEMQDGPTTQPNINGAAYVGGNMDDGATQFPFEDP